MVDLSTSAENCTQDGCRKSAIKPLVIKPDINNTGVSKNWTPQNQILDIFASLDHFLHIKRSWHSSKMSQNWTFQNQACQTNSMGYRNSGKDRFSGILLCDRFRFNQRFFRLALSFWHLVLQQPHYCDLFYPLIQQFELTFPNNRPQSTF